jgi:hypothetical protein
MTNFDYYLYYDHSARSKTAFMAIAMGAGTGMLSESLGASVTLSAVLCVSAIGIVEITRAWRYVQPAGERRAALDLPSATRRSLILVPVSALFLFILTLVPVSKVEAAVIERRLKESADNPFNPQNANDAEKTLIHAETSNIKLRPNVVEKTGKKFLDAAETESDPRAWDTALSFLDYRSFLNTDAQPILRDPQDDEPIFHTYYYDKWVEGTEHTPMRVFGKVPLAQSARLNLIGRNFQAGRTFGNAFLLIEGTGGNDSVYIDGMDMKNILIRHANIFYEGGPVIMENICFVNCAFRLIQNSTTAQLAAKVLESPCITFTAQ